MTGKANGEILNAEQIDFYHDQGYLVLENYLSDAIITAIRDEISRLSVPAASMTESDDLIDLEDSHSKDDPRIRRIKLPHKQSQIINDLLHSDTILAPARDLLGASIRLHTTKLNMKSPGYGAAIAWHQDFAFYPHTNDDVLAMAIIIDDMKTENGPLMVIPESHKGPIYDHHKDGVFVGGCTPEDAGFSTQKAVSLTAPAGSISFHHGRILHASAMNVSDSPRRLIFFEMMAADAFPIMGSMTKFDSIDDYNKLLLCGEPTVTPRLADVPMRIPQPQPLANKSIYEVQKSLTKEM